MCSPFLSTRHVIAPYSGSPYSLTSPPRRPGSPAHGSRGPAFFAFFWNTPSPFSGGEILGTKPFLDYSDPTIRLAKFPGVGAWLGRYGLLFQNGLEDFFDHSRCTVAAVVFHRSWLRLGEGQPSACLVFPSGALATYKRLAFLRPRSLASPSRPSR